VRRASTASILWVALVGGSAACESPGPVDLQVTWRFGTGDCDRAEVATVEADLFEQGRAAAIEHVEATCAAGHLTLEAIPPGQYSLTLLGRDPAGCGTHAARVVRVDAEDGLGGPVLLGLRPRPLVLTWDFAEAQDCRALGVVQIEALVQVGDAPAVRGAWLCGAATGELPEIPAGPADVTLWGLDAAGTTIARAEAAFGESALLAEPCAERFAARLTLEGCASAGCP
jgi:hypothetical protein